jgi:hypothetical protein
MDFSTLDLLADRSTATAKKIPAQADVFENIGFSVMILVP